MTALVASEHQVDPASLRALIDYDPTSGAMTWRARPADMFRTRRSCSIWNARYARRPVCGCVVGAGHRRVSISGTMIYAHRIAFALHYGRWPTAFLDHINGDALDNRIVNLREATKAENMRNRGTPRNSSSGFCGVSWVAHRGRWRAYINTRSGKRQHIGCFDDPVSAALAYDRRAVEEHGEFARLNFPSQVAA